MPLTALLTIAAATALAQSVQIISISAAPAQLTAKACTDVVVQVAVNRGTAPPPTLFLSVVKSHSFPANIEFEFAEGKQLELPSSGSISFRACPKPGTPPGRFFITAGILGVAPDTRYKILQPEDQADTVEVLVSR